MQDLIVINSNSVTTKIVMGISILATVLFGWFTVRWQLGDMLADLTPASDANAASIAEVAVNWAPADPTAAALRASAANDTAVSVELFEQAVRLAPNDYRRRIELARALEQDDRVERAEKEFKRATELAPAYAAAHWHLGNFYFRQERNTDAMAELKKAAENNRLYRDQVFSLVWDYFNKDASQMEAIAGDRPDGVSQLAYFLAAHSRAEDSLRNWNRLTDAEKARNKAVPKALAISLFSQRHFQEALEFSKQAGMDLDSKPGTVTNASFEKGLDGDPDSRFGWQFNRGDPKFDAVIDAKVKHEGSRSLRVTFKSYVKPSLANIIQTVVVEPNKKYRVRFWVRTENLKSSGGPLLAITNANDDQLIARSPGFPTGTNDWQEISVQFTTPANCTGVNIITIRDVCGEDCPLSGIFWYDDFEMDQQ